MARRAQRWGLVAEERGVPVVHLTAKMRPPHALFWAFDHASWFWERVREGYPGVLGLCLMPNHPHLLAEVDDPELARAGFARTCGHLQRRVGVRDLWEPVPRAEVIVGRQKLLRSIRYVALNPPRAQLCGGPLEWLWSTHRDVVGAVARPMVRPAVIARITGVRRARSAEWLHAYCSSDPTVRVEGTPFPTPAAAAARPESSLGQILRAAAVACRADAECVRSRGMLRRTFIDLARHQGWNDARRVAEVCGVRPGAVRKQWESLPGPELEAAALCLGDPRLLRRLETTSGVVSGALRGLRGGETTSEVVSGRLSRIAGRLLRRS